MTNHPIGLGIATLVMAILLGCGSEEDKPGDTAKRKVEPSAKTASESHDRAPFEYEVVSKEEMMHTWGPQVTVGLETTNEVAKKATEDDLRQLWKHIAPTLGDRRVFLRLRTPVPGALPWAMITRVNTDGEWKVDITTYEHGIVAEPYHFVNEIDRSVQNQKAMIVTLPMINRLNEQLVRRGWKVKQREEDFFLAESKIGIQSVSVTLTPEGMHIQAWMAEGNTFPDAVDVVFGELGIVDELKKKLYSVIGSPEYMRVAPGKPSEWLWTIGDAEVTYTRLPRMDDLSARYAG